MIFSSIVCISVFLLISLYLFVILLCEKNIDEYIVIVIKIVEKYIVDSERNNRNCAINIYTIQNICFIFSPICDPNYYVSGIIGFAGFLKLYTKIYRFFIQIYWSNCESRTWNLQLKCFVFSLCFGSWKLKSVYPIS
jgi:hypothetical protein